MARILIVDDEEGVRRTLGLIIQATGATVSLAADAETALASLARDRFDVVLTDIVMPGRDGLSLLADVKRMDDTIPVIIFTGELSLENATEAIRLGAFEFLEKPVRRDTIARLVGQAVAHRELLLQNRQLYEENRRLRGTQDLLRADGPQVAGATGDEGQETPVAWSEPAPTPDRSVAATPEGDPVILIFDSDPGVRGQVVSLLSGRRTTIAAADAAEALCNAVARSPERMLVRIDLPRLGGVDLIGECRSLGLSFPVVAYSALPVREDIRNRLRDLGVPLLRVPFTRRMLGDATRKAKRGLRPSSAGALPKVHSSVANATPHEPAGGGVRALALVVGGLLHDMANVLSGVCYSAQSALEEYRTGTPGDPGVMLSELKSIEAGAERLASIFGVLQSCVRRHYAGGDVKLTPDRLFRIALEAAEECGRDSHPIEVNLAGTPALVGLDLPGGVFEMLVRELLVNARKANAEKADLVVDLEFRFHVADGLLEIACADNGRGFSEGQVADPDGLVRGQDGRLHGLGFLWNVCSRLGGCLHVSRGRGGGALVQLFVVPAVMPGWERK